LYPGRREKSENGIRMVTLGNIPAHAESEVLVFGRTNHVYPLLVTNA